MTELDIFRFAGSDLRVLIEDGEPLFVAKDVASILGYRDAHNLIRRLDEDERGTRSVSTPSGDQQMYVITEPGLYNAILGSQLSAAREFKRWVIHQVLPALRKHGSYSIEQKSQIDIIRDQHQSITVLLDHTERLTAQVVALVPKADAWDELASAEGDYAVGDAAKILARAGIATGQQRLFYQLADIGWIKRTGERWFVYQTAVDAGYVTEKPQSRISHTTGERVIADPQVRVTVRGLERLRVRLGKFDPPAATPAPILRAVMS